MSPPILALDVYGTLIDPHAVVSTLEKSLGDRAGDFSQLWRTKQLEFSFRRGLMGAYADFSQVTRDALEFSARSLRVSLGEAEKAELLDTYTRLDAYSDTADALSTLREADCKLYAFSNGHPDALSSLLEHAGISELLDGTVSVHPVESFKPDPRVYEHFEAVTAAQPGDTWLVSSNAFDIAGARNVGWSAAWVQRDKGVPFDGWEDTASTTLSSLSEFPAYLNEGWRT